MTCIRLVYAMVRRGLANSKPTWEIPLVQSHTPGCTLMTGALGVIEITLSLRKFGIIPKFRHYLFGKSEQWIY